MGIAWARVHSDGVEMTVEEGMNVFVVDDAAEVRKRLVALVRGIPGVAVVGEADSMRAALDQFAKIDMDVMLLDLQLGDGSGLDVLARVKAQRPDVRVIVISNFCTEQYRRASLTAGAERFLDKSNEIGQLPGLLRSWLGSQGAGSPAGGM